MTSCIVKLQGEKVDDTTKKSTQKPRFVDREFGLYGGPDYFLEGEIKNGCLHLESDVYGEYSSEKHYLFTKEDTEKLFSLLTFQQFRELCIKGGLIGLEDYLEANGIKPSTFTF